MLAAILWLQLWLQTGLGMAGKIRHMINRRGRYHARIVVPTDLRPVIGKTELRSPLGGDYRQALRLLPGAVAQLQHQIALAERKAGQGTAPARYPLAPDQIAHSHYMQRLAFDDEARNDPRYAAVSVDDILVDRLRNAIAGRASDAELGELVGAQINASGPLATLMPNRVAPNGARLPAPCVMPSMRRWRAP